MLTMNTKTTARPSAPLWVRAAVWVMFAMTAFGSLSVAGAFDAPAQDTVPAPAPYNAVAVGISAEPHDGAETVRASARFDIITYGRATGMAPTEMLPMDRWAGASELKASNGWKDIPDAFTTGIASILFAVAALIWRIIVWSLSAALGLNIFAGAVAGPKIDAFFRQLSASVLGSGLMTFAMVLALIGACVKILKGKGGAIATVLAAMLPVALLMTLTANAGGTVTSEGGTETYVPTTGGPVWFATTGLTYVDEISGFVGSGLTALPDAPLEAQQYANTVPSCEAYKRGLYDTFEQWRTRGDITEDGVTVGGISDTNASGSLRIVSYLWERAYLSQWIQAQYGGSRAGSRMWCHQMEAEAGTPRAMQVEIGIAGGYPSIDDRTNSSLGSPADLRGYSDWHDDIDDEGAFDGAGMWDAGSMGIDGGALPLFQDDSQAWPARRDPYTTIDHGWSKAYQASLFLWAACVFADDGTIAPQAAWAEAGDVHDKDCELFWYGGVIPGQGSGERDYPDGSGGELMQWGDSLGDKTSGTMAGRETTPETAHDFNAATSDDLGDIRDLVNAFRGDNGAERILAGFMAIITALAYAYVLGGIAVGALMMKVGFGLAIAFLPGTLLLYALYARSTSKSHPGKRLTKITVGFMCASFVLTGMLVLLLQTILLLETLIGTALGGLTTILIPIIALIIVRKALKLIGMGDIATAKGAIGMGAVTLAAAQSDGKRINSAKKAVREVDSGTKGLSSQLSKSRAGRFLQAPKAPFTKGAREEAAAAVEAKKKAIMQKADREERTHAKRHLDAAAKATSPEQARAHMAKYAQEMVGIKERTERRGGPLLAEAWMAKALRNGAPARMTPAESASRELALKKAGAIGEGNLGADLSSGVGITHDADGNEILTTGTAAERLLNQQSMQLAGSHQVLRDDDGNVMIDPGTNQPIYGFSKQDADGNTQMVSLEEAGYNAVTGELDAGFTKHLMPRTDLTAAEAGAARDAHALGLGLDNGLVLGSSNGMRPVVRLQSPTATDPLRFATASTTEGSMDIARDAVHYIPNIYKERMSALVQSGAISEDGQNMMINLLSVKCGGIDPATGQKADFLLNNDIDLETDQGLAQLEAYQAGDMSSPIASLEAKLSHTDFNQVVAQVQRYEAERKAPSDAVATDIATARATMATASAPTHTALAVRRAKLAELQALQRSVEADSGGIRPTNTSYQAEIDRLDAAIRAEQENTIELINKMRMETASLSTFNEMADMIKGGNFTAELVEDMAAYNAGAVPQSYEPIDASPDMDTASLVAAIDSAMSSFDAASSAGTSWDGSKPAKKQSAQAVVKAAKKPDVTSLTAHAEVTALLQRMHNDLSGESAGLCIGFQKALKKARHVTNILDDVITHAEDNNVDDEILNALYDIKRSL